MENGENVEGKGEIAQGTDLTQYVFCSLIML